MGRHRAPEGKQPGRLRTIIVNCQPFYKRYRKAIISAGGTAISLAIAAYTDGQISRDEWYFIGTQVLATLGVYQFPNATNKKVVKPDVNV